MVKENSFEQSVKRLEEIVSALENQDTSLEQAMVLFQEGVALTEECSLKLKQAKQAVDVLIEKNSEMSKEEFVSDAE